MFSISSTRPRFLPSSWFSLYLQVDRMDHRLVCLTLFLVLLADTARGQGCGLSAFQHVPQTHCRGDISTTSDRSVEACAQACCDNPDCKSFQFSTLRNCYLINKICTAEEKFRTPAGNMYDRIQGESKAPPAPAEGCGLSAFQHVPQTHCPGGENLLSRTSDRSVEDCAQACCDNPACKSFQFSTYGDCYLISKICTAGEKMSTPAGNMYDRIQGESKAPAPAPAGCGLSAFQHVPGTHCLAYGNVLSKTKRGSAEACAQACCDNPACKSFQFSTEQNCYLISKICTAGEKIRTPTGNMYDRIQASKRMVEAKETLQDLRDVLLDLEEAAEIDQ
ncbi:uncharacterized protein LOC118412131 isoform X1 [Branchiostoma floridae]|uniref:Uncharacterized protein LOC118412131 isoform X1 n=1 Tax=Branchiostoma floridae TaxID=7739 RepID=A0A9J7MKU6_BRAFL|nr:uncharacterized protein LOC118412131 isoform X1 [Branchiostoma floridae]